MRQLLCALLFLALLGGCGSDVAESVSEAEAESEPESELLPSDTTAPTFPEDAALGASAPGRLDAQARTVTLHWPSASDDEAVEAYLVTVDDGEPTRVGAEVDELELEGIGFEHPHTFAVRAVDAAGNSSEALSTADALAPSFAEGAEVSVRREGAAFVLSWPEAEDDVAVVGYAVLRGEDELASLDADARSYRVTDGNPDFHFEVAALDAAGHKTRIGADTEDLEARASVIEQLNAIQGGLLGALGPPPDLLADGISDTPQLGAAEVIRGAGGTRFGAPDDPPEEPGGILRAIPRRSEAQKGSAPRTAPRKQSISIGGGRAPRRRVSGQVRVSPEVQQAGPGSLPSEIVIRMMMRRRRAVQACYERALRSAPRASGEVEVRITITPEGIVGDVTLVRSTAPDAVDECVERVVRRFRFNPGPEGGATTLTYTLTFTPR